jgi:transposase
MKKMQIIGVDMSKDKFDFHCYGHPVTPDPLTNTIKGFRQFEKWMKTAVSHVKQEVLIVMEYTGIYTYNIERFLNDKGWSYVKRPGLDIKRSVGMQRGKTDSADARMISKYGWMNKEILKPTKPVKDSLVELQQLMSYRDKLVADKASYQVRFKELSEQMGNKFSKTMGRSIQHVLTLLTKEIHEIEEAIQQCVARDEQVHKNYNLLRTISGIGFVTAVSLIITTENFTRFSDHRKFACYCGVAPFMYRSGSSIRGKTRVSHLANKKIKSLLTMCVLTAVRTDAGLKAKYDQKCKEQKPKMSVINIIRAKLIERIFAVINRQTPYLKMAA